MPRPSSTSGACSVTPPRRRWAAGCAGAACPSGAADGPVSASCGGADDLRCQGGRRQGLQWRRDRGSCQRTRRRNRDRRLMRRRRTEFAYITLLSGSLSVTESPAPSTAVRICPLRTIPLVVSVLRPVLNRPAAALGAGAGHSFTARRSNPSQTARTTQSCLARIRHQPVNF
jgi:hypothetical protein